MNYKTEHTKDYWVFILDDGSTNNFGNETLSENDALMMLQAREEKTTKIAHTDTEWVFCPPNRDLQKFSKDTVTESEAWNLVQDYIKETEPDNSIILG